MSEQKREGRWVLRITAHRSLVPGRAEVHEWTTPAYVTAYDPDAPEPLCVRWSSELRRAKLYPTREAAMLDYMRVSILRPTKGDGSLNRPMFDRMMAEPRCVDCEP